MQENNQKVNILNSKLRDSAGKVIFDDPTLCAQFLRNYVGIPMLKDVRPEDIEDVSERYVPLIGEERNADTVKRINLYGKAPLFLISLIEHKTEVDYNVSMQIFRYMVYIWEDYERDMEQAYTRGICKTKNFRYPPVLPIVYYEGKAEWTAPLELKDRILCSDILQQYIPNYKYHLVELKDYSNHMLLEKQDEISLIMLINKIQSRKDVELLRNIPPEVLDRMIRDTPERLLDLIATVFRTLLIQLNVPEQETEEMVGKVKVRKMGELFANADFDDIRRDWQKVKDARKETERYKEQTQKYREQSEKYREEIEKSRKEIEESQKEIEESRREIEDSRKKIEESRKKIEESRKKIEESRKEAEESRKEAEESRKEAEESRKESEDAKRKREDSIRRMIEKVSDAGKKREEAKQDIMDIFGVSGREAEQKLKRYWNIK